MNVLDSKFARAFIRMADDGWRQNWHERNGGNLSYRLKPAEVSEIRESLDFSGEWRLIGTAVPELAGEFFLVTGSGKFFRNIILAPEENICVIELDGAGERFRVCWGLCNGGRPTMELPTHLMNHEVKARVTGGAHRVIYHAHPVNVIALTFVLPFEDEAFTRELWEMITECAIVFPGGVGTVEWMVPGGREAAVATSEKMLTCDAAVWAYHGLFVSGEDFDVTFGLAHTIEKAAEVLVKVLSMGGKRQTMTPEMLRRLEVPFGITLDERFLGEK